LNFGRIQLYNLSDDPAESFNAIDKHPEIVKKLSEELIRVRAQKSSR